MSNQALVYDCPCGMSGDIHIGAMLDLGVPLEYLQAALASLNIADEFDLKVERGQKMGISGTRATVVLRPDIKRPHRHLRHVREIINSGTLTRHAQELAHNMFAHVARAEAQIHDIDIEAVHFHEVGATDSIVDIVAAAVAIDWLAPSSVYLTQLELGSGTVRCEHGVMPVPAPATAAILLGVPCQLGGVDGEATTPTGAAILKEILTSYRSPDTFTVRQIGYGVGQKDFSRPNVARVMLGEVDPASGTTAYSPEQAGTGLVTETNTMIEANIDDMSPEAFAPLLDRLFDAGAKDVFYTPIVMKKSRPATTVSVLCDPKLSATLIALILSDTTSIGLRSHNVTKHMLPREERQVSTGFGPVSVKIVTLPDGRSRWKAAHDDVARVAQTHGLSYLDARQHIDEDLGQALIKRHATKSHSPAATQDHKHPDDNGSP